MTKNKLLQECINVMKTPTTASLPVPASGEEQTFGRFVAKKLLPFDKYTKLIAEKRITEILFELEMNMLTESHSELQASLESYPPQPTAFGLQVPLRNLYPHN